MALTRGARKLYDWLKEQKSGAMVPYEEVMKVTGWSDVSLKTYLRKNKISPFLQRVENERLKVMLNGEDISETFFDETFTQTAPRTLTLAVGDQFQGENAVYELVEPLGYGAIGQVWSARSAEDVGLVAVKVMLPRGDLLQGSKLPNIRERFRREARNGRTLEHPNLIRYLDVGNAEKNPFLVMELADRSVADQLKASGAIPEEESAEIVGFCASALKYLHGKSCPHRDVKPANLLEFKHTIKLGDLGIVKWSDFDEAFTKGGTITRQSVQLGSWFYMAPEQQESPHDASNKSDIYALGVTWIEMLVGTLPAPHAVGAGAYKLPVLRDGVSYLIRRMCSYTPDQRPALDEILDVISKVYS